MQPQLSTDDIMQCLGRSIDNPQVTDLVNALSLAPGGQPRGEPIVKDGRLVAVRVFASDAPVDPLAGITKTATLDDLKVHFGTRVWFAGLRRPCFILDGGWAAAEFGASWNQPGHLLAITFTCVAGGWTLTVGPSSPVE